MDSLDSMFQQEQYKNEEKEIQTFESNRLRKERVATSHAPYIQLDQQKLTELYGQGESAKTKAATTEKNSSEILSDMPKQQVDEKESTRKRKEKAQLKKERKLWESKQEEAAQRLNERIADIKNKGQTFDQIPLDEQAIALFDDKIDAQTLTPRYVLEHFAEVREKLDAWKAHIEMFSRKGELYGYLPDEYRTRLSQMGVMYYQSEEAFASALGALGYRYQPEAKGDKRLVNDLTEDEKKQKLDENRKQRGKLADTAAKMDEETAREMYQQKGRYFRRGDDGDAVRDQMSQNPRYAFIQSKYLNTREQYEEIAEIKDLTVQYARQYEANKEKVNRLYMEFYKLLEADARCRKEFLDLEWMGESTQLLGMQKVSKCFEKRGAEEKKKQDILNERARSIKAGIRHILCGEELGEKEILVLKDYLPEKYDPLANETKDQALAYIQKSQEKQGIFENTAEQFFGDQAKEMTNGAAGSFMALMKAGEQAHNEQVMRSLITLKTYQTMKRAGGAAVEEAELEMGRTMKPLVMPYLARIEAFDTIELENATPKELTAQNAELQELALICQNIADLGKYRDPDNAEKRSIIESACDGDTALFTLKCEVIRTYAEKARAFSIMRAYGAGSLTEEALSAEEKEKLEKKEDGSIAPVTMLNFAKALLTKSMSTQAAAYDKYYASENARQYYTTMKIQKKKREAEEDSKHTRSTHMPELQEALKKEKDYLNTVALQRSYDECKQRISEIESEKEGVEGEEADRLQRELTELKQHMEMLQIQAALTRESTYQRIGYPESLGEPLFRSYRGVEAMQSFHDMSNEEFKQMCVQLSAGALETDKEKPERFEYYYAENLKGLRTYKQHMAEHYEMLERKFHHKLPTQEYIEANREELTQLFSNGQIDFHMVERMRDLFDLTDPKDLRIYHLVNFYYTMGIYIDSFGTLIVGSQGNGNITYREASKMLGSTMNKLQASVAYLEKHPENEEIELVEGPQTQEEAQKTQRTEKFRKLAEDAKTILMKPAEEQWAYLESALECQDYIEQHQEDTSFIMRQYQGWLDVARARLPLLGKKLYHAYEQTEDHGEALASVDTMRAEIRSGDPQRCLNALHEMVKSVNYFSSTAQGLEDQERSELSLIEKYHQCEITAVDEAAMIPEEMKDQFLQAFNERRARLYELFVQKIEQRKAELPEDIEDRELLATYLVWQTRLGREYESLYTANNTYCLNTTMYEKTLAMEKASEENRILHKKLTDMAYQLANAYTKYQDKFKRLGYLKGLAEEGKRIFLQQFSNEG